MNTKDIVYIALFAAITAGLGILPFIKVPISPVPVTAQSLGLMLAGSILGPKRGALSQILFLGLVTLGLPILTGGNGGIGILLGPSGGFLLGWPIGAFIIGFLFKKKWASLTPTTAFTYMVVGGILVVYAMRPLQFISKLLQVILVVFFS